MRPTTRLLLGVAMLLPLAATADRDSRPAQGYATNYWLELQRGGSQAAASPVGNSADVSENVYQLYLDSFKHPIPETFKRDEGQEFISGSSGQ